MLSSDDQAQPNEESLKVLIDGIIKNNDIDMGIFTLKMKTESAPMFQIEGVAKDKTHIAVLLKALEAEQRTSKVYLVSIEEGAINGRAHQGFVVSAEYSSP